MPAYEDRSFVYTRLGRKRVERDLSQTELGNKAGVSLATVQRLEAGQIADPGIVTLIKLAWALDCDLDELIEDAWRQRKPLERRLTNDERHRRLAQQ